MKTNRLFLSLFLEIRK